MQVRKALGQDLQNVIDLMIDSDLRELDWAIDRATRYITDKKGLKVLLIAEDNGLLVGYIGIKIKPDEDHKSLKINNAGLITWIAVRQEYRKNKIGSLLLQSAFNCIKNNGKNTVFLTCIKKYIPFYLKNKFKIINKYEDKGVVRYVLLKSDG